MNEGNANSRRFEGKFTVSLGTSTPENIYRHTSKNISLKIIASFQHQQNSSSGVFSEKGDVVSKFSFFPVFRGHLRSLLLQSKNYIKSKLAK